MSCRHSGCAALIPYGQMYCDEHKLLYVKDRASASERGYGAKWQRERKKFSESNPFCVKCYEEGRRRYYYGYSRGLYQSTLSRNERWEHSSWKIH